MNKTEQRVYLTPEVEVVEFAVEQGFDGSLGGIDPMPSNPGENPEMPDVDDEW